MNNKTKFYYENEETTVGAYCNKVAGSLELDGDQVKKVLMAVYKGNEYEDNPELDDEENSIMATAFEKVAEDLASHKESIEAMKEAKNKEAEAKKLEKEAKEKKKQEMALLVREAPAVAAPKELEIGQALIKKCLPPEFGISSKTGRISFKKGATVNMEHIAKGINAFQAVFDQMQKGTDAIAFGEADFIIAVEKVIGDEWINLFSERKGDILRIRKYKKIAEMVEPNNRFTTLTAYRELLEGRYDEDDEKNDKMKQKAIAQAKKVFDSEGKVTAAVARQIAKDLKGDDESSPTDLRFLYIMVMEDGTVEWFRHHEVDKGFFESCTALFDMKMKKQFNSEGKREDIPEVTEAIIEAFGQPEDSVPSGDSEDVDDEEEEEDDSDVDETEIESSDDEEEEESSDDDEDDDDWEA